MTDETPTQRREQDRIQCLECGRWFRALPTHLLRRHDMTDEDYRLKFLVPATTPLVCIAWSENKRADNIRRGARRTLTGRGRKGVKQRESVRKRRAAFYRDLAMKGRAAALKTDKTAARRARLAPYPVTVADASERLGCTTQAAYNFLSYCVAAGKLRRVRRGLYAEV